MKSRQLYSMTIEDLKKVIEYAENRADHDSMEHKIYFEVTGNDNLNVKQYCHYAECNPIYHRELKNEA